MSHNHWVNIGIIRGWKILRLKDFPAFLIDTTPTSDERYRAAAVKLCERLEENGITVDQGKEIVKGINLKIH